MKSQIKLLFLDWVLTVQYNLTQSFTLNHILTLLIYFLLQKGIINIKINNMNNITVVVILTIITVTINNFFNKTPV